MITNLRNIAFIFFVFIPNVAIAERPLEDANYYEAVKAIKDMSLLHSLGVTGELIGIYKAISQASYAAEVLHNRKWRPGEDDLGWVDYQESGKARNPYAGIDNSDIGRIKNSLSNIEHLNDQIESGQLSTQEKVYAIKKIQGTIKYIKRILVQYPEHYFRAFPNKGSLSAPLVDINPNNSIEYDNPMPSQGIFGTQ